MKNRIQVFSWISLLMILLICQSSWSAEKVLVSQVSRSFVYMPAYVAFSKGFFKDEGLEPALVQMRAQVSSAALETNQTQYAFGGSTTFMSAIIQGFPFKLMAVLPEKPLHFIIARKEVGSLSDLRGKKFAVSRIGGADHLAAVEILKSKGVDNIQFVSVGGDEPVRAEFLRNGIIDGTALGPPFPMVLVKQGYRILGTPGDTTQGVLSGMWIKTDRLKEKRDEVKRSLRALFRGIRFFHEQRDETISIMMQWLNQDRALTSESYDLIRPHFTADGITSDGNIAFNIELLKELVKSNRSVSSTEVRDFTIIREVHKDLGYGR